MLKNELENLMYTNVPDLAKSFVQQYRHAFVAPPDKVTLASPLQAYEDLINQKFNEILKDTSEESVLDWITPLLKHISDDLHKQLSKFKHSRNWRSLRNNPIKGIDAQHQLDGAIMSKDRYDIRDVLVPVEHKKNTSDAAEAARCLAKYVYEVFNAQPTRSYVVGVTLCGTSMQLWKFDRSGAIGSEPLDIKENEENFNEFLSLIILFLTSNEQVLGFDPTFFDIDAETCNPPQKSMKIGRQSGPEELVIHRRIFRALGICGRGTTCWEAHLPGDANQKFLVKDSW
jgi:hypothetical protein